jgi:glycosidase
VHFTENHDEPRAVAAFGSYAAANAASVALLTLPGMRLVNYLQWEGRQLHLNVHLSRFPEETPNSPTIEFWHAFFAVLRSEALRIGEWARLAVSDADSVLAWTWITKGQRVLVAVNFSDGPASARVKGIIASGPDIQFRDLIAGKNNVFTATDCLSAGLLLTFSPWEIHIFEF